MGDDTDSQFEQPAEDGSGGGESTAQDKRKHVRYKVSFKVIIRLSSGDFVQAQAVDLSGGGIYLEYGSTSTLGKVFEMAFDLPFSDDFKRVIVKARLVRSIVIGSRNTYGLAFVFTEFATETEEILDNYLEFRSTKQM